VLKVTSLPASDPSCNSTIASTLAWYIDEVTKRPIYGVIIFCLVQPGRLKVDIAFAVHEIMHALVRAIQLFCFVFELRRMVDRSSRSVSRLGAPSHFMRVS
jgi:hypothetical protein